MIWICDLLPGVYLRYPAYDIHPARCIHRVFLTVVSMMSIVSTVPVVSILATFHPPYSSDPSMMSIIQPFPGSACRFLVLIYTKYIYIIPEKYVRTSRRLVLCPVLFLCRFSVLRRRSTHAAPARGWCAHSPGFPFLPGPWFRRGDSVVPSTPPRIATTSGIRCALRYSKLVDYMAWV